MNCIMGHHIAANPHLLSCTEPELSAQSKTFAICPLAKAILIASATAYLNLVSNTQQHR